MEKKSIKKKTTVKAVEPDGIKIVLNTANKDYVFTGDSLQILFGLEPEKTSGKTTISVTKNGLTYIKTIKPMLLKKFLGNRTFLTILEKQITSLLK